MDEGPGLTWIRVGGAVIRAPSSRPEGNGEGGPGRGVCTCGKRAICASCCMGRGRGWASLLQICIPADFYFKPCLFLLKTWLLCQELESN